MNLGCLGQRSGVGARSSVADRSHVRHDLGQSTTPEQEAIISTLRTDARPSLDDITGVMRRCLSPALSRSAVWRCLCRQGLNGPLKPEPGVPPNPVKPFDAAAFGYVHVDL